MAHRPKQKVELFVVGICPKCGGHMALRQAKTTGNRFLGCDNYPECRFTCTYDETIQRLSNRIVQLEQGQRASGKYDPKLHPHLRAVEGGNGGSS